MKTRKILIIDDENDFTLVMKSVFEKHDYEVFTADNFSEGLLILEQEQPDVLFLDNKLPDGYGWRNLDYIQSNFPNTQITLISAFDVPKTSSASFRIMEKPILLGDLETLFEQTK